MTENNETEQGIVLSETPVDVGKRHMIGISRVKAALIVTVDDTAGTKMSPNADRNKSTTEFAVIASEFCWKEICGFDKKLLRPQC